MSEVTSKQKISRREFLKRAAGVAASSALPSILNAAQEHRPDPKPKIRVVEGEQPTAIFPDRFLAEYSKTSPIMHGRVSRFCNQHGDVVGLTDNQKNIFTLLTLMRFDIAWEKDPKIEFKVKGNYSNEKVKEMALGISDLKRYVGGVEKGKALEVELPQGLEYRFTEASARHFLGTASSNRQMMAILLSGKYSIAKQISHVPFEDKAIDVGDSWRGFYLTDRRQKKGMVAFFDKKTNEPIAINIWPGIGLDLSNALEEITPSKPFSFKGLGEAVPDDFAAGWKAAKVMGWTEADIPLLYDGVKSAEKEVSQVLGKDFKFDGFVITFQDLITIAAVHKKEGKSAFLANPLEASPSLLRDNIKGVTLHELAHEAYDRGRKGMGGSNLYVKGTGVIELDYNNEEKRLEYGAAMEVMADTIGSQLSQDKKEYLEAFRSVNEMVLKKREIFLKAGAPFNWEVYTDLAGIAIMASRFGLEDIHSRTQKMVLDSVQGNTEDEAYLKYNEFYNELDGKTLGIRLRQ